MSAGVSQYLLQASIKCGLGLTAQRPVAGVPTRTNRLAPSNGQHSATLHARPSAQRCQDSPLTLQPSLALYFARIGNQIERASGDRVQYYGRNAGVILWPADIAISKQVNSKRLSCALRGCLRRSTSSSPQFERLFWKPSWRGRRQSARTRLWNSLVKLTVSCRQPAFIELLKSSWMPMWCVG